MTSDLDASTDDLYRTIRALYQQAQGTAGDEAVPPAGFGQSVVSIRDTEIAAATELELEPVREFLDHADGVKLVIGRDGETRTVKSLL